ncbi:hypothetical protein L1987_38421 [Smallanthus sonchifolius]|uniref:Uncharacterized protein n=1 Tax=Smallanthus sonchifolius TaxID=185202 RepID=A0ACB9HK21_9ASTR|nr:hypothetical protein L1987_38421 [Smallanthus sonchifolius]
MTISSFQRRAQNVINKHESNRTTEDGGAAGRWRKGKATATHIQQALLRQKRQLVLKHLKLERTKRAPIVPNPEQNSNDGVTKVAVRRSKRKVKEESEGVSNVPRKRVRKIKKEDSGEGRSVHKAGSSVTGFRRPIRFKNNESVPIAVEKHLPNISENIKATEKKKTTSTGFRRPIWSKNSEPVPIAVEKHLPNISENIKAVEKKTASTGFRRPIRTKISEPVPITVEKHLPSIRENVKASAKKEIKKKIIKKCHWCGLV